MPTVIKESQLLQGISLWSVPPSSEKHEANWSQLPVGRGFIWDYHHGATSISILEVRKGKFSHGFRSKMFILIL